MRINRRLVLLTAVPLAVAVTFSVLALVPATSQAIQAHRLTTMVDAAGSAGRLTHLLQRERAAATALVAGQGGEVALQKRSNATDDGIDRFRKQRDELSSVPDHAATALDRIERSMEELPTMRARARSGSSTLSALAFGYRIVIADLIDYRDGIAQAEGVEAHVADRVRAAAALSRAAEQIGRQQVAVMRALAGGGFTPASQRTFEATRLGYDDSVGVMFALGPQKWRSWLQGTLSGAKTLEALRLEDEVGRSRPDQTLSVEPRAWLSATEDRLTLLRSVERRVDESLLGTVAATATTLTWWAVAEVLVVLLTLVAAVVVATRLGRVMIQRLQQLRNAAHEVAYTRLPQVMTELSRPGALSGTTPEEVAQRSGSPVRTTGRDEFGEVGEAFNAVHHEAVRLTALQAHSHERFAETLASVARRGAQLTSVMVSELDAVQRDEADPQRMKVLFALDHLAVRMERNTNSLLVLGGYGQGRARMSDASCSTVVVAAAQQIERFERVDLGIVEPGIGITARVVHDLAHILAELLDNATRFSPPGTRVGVAAWRLWDRAVVQIVDEGLGLPADRREEINAALTEPRTDVGAVRSMGLHVVARLAARHGIVVELRDSDGPGTIAEVTLPAAVLATAPEPGGPESPPGPLSRGLIDPPGARGAQRQPTTWTVSEPPGRGEPSGRGEPPGRGEPADRVAGVSRSGLPLRRRQPPEEWPRLGGQDDTERGSAPAPGPESRRDSRQISNVLAAYTQGINRSTNRRAPSAGPNTGRSAHDDTRRRTS